MVFGSFVPSCQRRAAYRRGDLWMHSLQRSHSHFFVRWSSELKKREGGWLMRRSGVFCDGAWQLILKFEIRNRIIFWFRWFFFGTSCFFCVGCGGRGWFFSCRRLVALPSIHSFWSADVTEPINHRRLIFCADTFSWLWQKWRCKMYTWAFFYASVATRMRYWFRWFEGYSGWWFLWQSLIIRWWLWSRCKLLQNSDSPAQSFSIFISNILWISVIILRR